MNRLLLTNLAIIVAVTAAFIFVFTKSTSAAIWELNNPSLQEISEGYKSGEKYQNYAGVVRDGPFGKITPSSGYLFKDDLKIGSVLPSIVDAVDLLAAAKKEQKVLIAGDVWNVCVPVLAEIARQNQVSCNYLINHLNINWDDAAGTNIFATLSDVTEQVQDIVDAATDGLAEEITQEVAEEIKETIEEFTKAEQYAIGVRGDYEREPDLGNVSDYTYDVEGIVDEATAHDIYYRVGKYK